ncbi:MAG: hypothetical protein HYZ13_09320 [Acidobacteria bacterium]|nr:hypothetical protein [Acidobacteriota bacterium]
MTEIEIPLFRVRKGSKVGFQVQAQAPPPVSSAEGALSPAARSLALGHRCVKAVEAGEAQDFTDLARSLGISQARVSQLVALTFLAPDIQEDLLQVAPGTERLTIHHLLLVARRSNWKEQRGFWAGLRGDR